jgi:hypothetical protein
MPILSGPDRYRMLKVGLLVGFGLWLEGWIGVLLLALAADLALSRQPFGARPVCWPALGVMATGLLLVDPAFAFAFGWLVEIACDPALDTILSAGSEMGSIQGCEGAEDERRLGR